MPKGVYPRKPRAKQAVQLNLFGDAAPSNTPSNEVSTAISDTQSVGATPAAIQVQTAPEATQDTVGGSVALPATALCAQETHSLANDVTGQPPVDDGTQHTAHESVCCDPCPVTTNNETVSDSVDADQPYSSIVIEPLADVEKEDGGLSGDASTGHSDSAPDWKGVSEHTGGFEMCLASDVETKEIDWLWNGWLARGHLHLLAGEPGVCKTTLAMSYAAIVTNGGVWPDGTKCDRPQRVLFWSNEDDLATFIVPRLEAAGAKKENFGEITGIILSDGTEPFNPSLHMHIIEESIDQASCDIGLFILDSIADVVEGDSHKNSDVRRSLKALTRLAQRHKIAVLGIVHLNKANSRNPINRVIGSVGFVGMARLVQVVVEDENNPDNRRLARLKSNLGDMEGGFLLGVDTEMVGKEKTIEAPYIVWKDALPGNGKDIICPPKGEDDSPPRETETDKAKKIIQEMMRSAGNTGVPAASIYARCKEHFITERIIKRAKKLLGIPHKTTASGSVWFAP